MATSNFEVLKEMSDRNCESLKLFTETNLQELRMGNEGWGHVKFAIDNNTIYDVLKSKSGIRLVVLSWDQKDFDDVAKSLEDK